MVVLLRNDQIVCQRKDADNLSPHVLGLPDKKKPRICNADSGRIALYFDQKLWLRPILKVLPGLSRLNGWSSASKDEK